MFSVIIMLQLGDKFWFNYLKRQAGVLMSVFSIDVQFYHVLYLSDAVNII